MKTRAFASLLFALLWGVAGSAAAAPLTFAELDQLNGIIECRVTCEHGKLAKQAACLAACPSLAVDWDKDRDGDRDRKDVTLAYLEYVDDGDLTAMCYENDAVVPIAACGLADCLATRSQAQCADQDHDGLRAFQETLIGTSDTVAQVSCTANTQCGSTASACSATASCSTYQQSCELVTEVNRSICRPRQCTGGACTAFHLEQVAADNNEVIVRVHYDYSPVPVRVLDLHLDYDQSSLTLLDSRPLPALTAHGKTLQTRHVDTGKLRLMVLSPSSTRDIQTGPIAELVFTRIAPGQVRIAFSVDNFHQEWSVAPDPGANKAALRNDALWGKAITVGARDANGPRLVLHYSFDNARAPLAYKSVSSAETLANLSFRCTQPNNCTPEELSQKAKLTAQAAVLQSGVNSLSESVEGVYGTGAKLDGAANHLELPISLNGAAAPFSPQNQGFSLSLWAYHEPNVARTSSLHGDLLFSHNHGTSENTRFGLLAMPVGTGTYDLVWFEGDLGDPNLPKTVVKAGLTDKRWTHVGLSVDGITGNVRVFVDGAPNQGVALQLAGAPAVQCPAFNNGNLQLHDQGDITGGRAPEQLTFASAQNGLFGIDRMEPRGLDRQSVLRPTNSVAIDPDYSAIVDRIVYVSSASGNQEIWVAHADGSEPKQVTQGFADTGRGVFSRRPRWAPDGSAIVFESNMFDVRAGDNTYARGYHLYYVPYDPIANGVAVPQAEGPAVDKLVYRTLLDTQTVLDYRLTKADRNHSNAVWLRGKFTDVDGVSYLGELMLNTADRKYDDKRVARLRIATRINNVTAEPVSLFTSLEPSASVSMLAGHWNKAPNQVVTERLFLQKEWISYGAASGISVHVEPGASGDVAVVTYEPPQADERCYDHNRNNTCDGAAEDRNGDGACTPADCTAADLSDLFLAYDKNRVLPTLNADGGVVAAPGQFLTQNNKQLRLADVHTSDADLVKLEVASPVNDRPIPSGTELLRLPLRRVTSGDPGLNLVVRRVRQELYVKTNAAEPVRFDMPSSDLERVLEADFSPDGLRLALAGIQGARPVVVATKNLAGTAGIDKASIVPMRVQGLDWERVERLFPCNWIGAFRNPYSGFYVSAFRGAIDEVRVHSYARLPLSFQSEADRGRERLTLDGRGGTLPGEGAVCTHDLECPPYQLCGESGRCATEVCNPQDPYSCQRGLCNLQPVPVSLDETSPRWVCSVECNADAQCFQQECLNGPCRFCSPQTESCIECQETVQNIGGLNIASIEGCPDRNSFACEQGSCVTECYSIENGESRYLCDAATEYCKQGRCMLFDWSWSDFAPATFAGAGEVAFDLPNVNLTTAISQLYPIEIEAYGVEDYGHPPELLVEGRIDTEGAQTYGPDWFELGRVLVYNKTRAEAGGNKYVVMSAHPVTNLRLRLITPPYENLNSASTGLMVKDTHFCQSATWSESDRSACLRRAQGSRPTVGYAVSIPESESRRACAARGRQNCPSYENRTQDPAQAYLAGGQPTVIVRGLKVLGTSVLGGSIATNRVCSYEGTLVPFDGERPRRLFFGDVSREQSNQKNAYYANHPATSLLDARSVTGSSWALLNCNFANPENANDVAELRVNVPVQLYPNPNASQLVDGAISENANGCFVTHQDGTREPCREFVGGEVSMDPFGDERQLHRTLDYDGFTSFGEDVEETGAP